MDKAQSKLQDNWAPSEKIPVLDKPVFLRIIGNAAVPKIPIKAPMPRAKATVFSFSPLNEILNPKINKEVKCIQR